MIWFIIFGGIILLFGFVVFFGAPYVPSQRRYVRRAFEELYKLGPKDVLVDVGSGDGVVLRIAAEKGARAIGYEINPALVLISRLLSRNSKISVRLANFWQTQLPKDTTVVYGFAVSRDINKLSRKLQAEANRLKRDIVLLTFGAHPKQPAEKEFEAYALHRFHPLQSEKPQV